MRPRIKSPSYRFHKGSGQARVTLDGKDHYLGPFGSPQSHREYARLIAEWKAQTAGGPAPLSPCPDSLTVVELASAYLDWAEGYYVKNGEATSEMGVVKIALGPVLQRYGDIQAREFGPLALKQCRERMIAAGWERKQINRHVGRVRRMFRWGVENELVRPAVLQALQAVAGLRRGRSTARESKAVKPVPQAFVEAIERFVSRPLWGMIELQQLTGMRPGEVCIMRTCDIETSGRVWVYRPESHKTEHHDREREVYLGPQSQEIVRPFLKTELQAFLFSPREALDERRAELRRKRKTRVQPSQQNRRRTRLKKQPGDRYTTISYRRAIANAIERANAARDETQEAPIPHWHPNQLRHSAGTRARKEGGLELAQIVLGHSKADVTQVYAERDRTRGIEFAARFG